MVYGLVMDLERLPTDTLIALRNALAGWDVPFHGDREALIDEVHERQESRDRHMQPQQFGVVF